ncbi:hypothetical protein F5I97DRAFT_109108 [Phlebopus sp. FC_14]|nr:hypothetical protein F5I97DRAFT_109108 [Phlebopus sp. FC_14]
MIVWDLKRLDDRRPKPYHNSPQIQDFTRLTIQMSRSCHRVFCAPRLFDNKICIEVPLKHQEIYRFTYLPEFPGPVTIELRPSPEFISLATTAAQSALDLALDDSTTEPESDSDILNHVLHRRLT